MWWKVVGVIGLVLFGVPLLLGLLFAFDTEGGGSDAWLLLVIALVVLAIYQRRQVLALHQRLDAELGDLRERLTEERGTRERAIAALQQARTALPVVPPSDTPRRATPAQEVAAPPTPVPAAAVPAESALAEAPSPAAATAATPATGAGQADRLPRQRPPAQSAEGDEGAVPARQPDDASARRPVPMLEVDERAPAVTTSAVASALAWFRGGNTIVRVAVLILFVGVAFLVRYAADHALLPLELRLAAVAAGGIALLGVGWRLRERRRGYGLSLQGAGVGVLYMTVYAAMRLYALVPPSAGLALLVAMAVLSAVLALRQDALPLAVAGVVGGFAAPLLASTGEGNHVLLFAYCGVLNLGIAVIAQRRAWRLLNLVGFVCTSLVAAAWGSVGWQPERLATTEPFLVAHWVLFTYVAVAYARRVQALDNAGAEARATAPATAAHEGAMHRLVPYVDASLLFGVPIVAAGFQAVLVRHVPYGLAASAAVMSAAYLLLGRWLWRHAGEGLRRLTEGLFALGAVFLMLVAPLAVDARWTAGAWALQGAGMVWIALRQRRPWALLFGLALQPLAALSFWGRPLPDEGLIFMANARFTGVLLLAAAALGCAWLLQRVPSGGAEPLPPWARPAWPVLNVAALALGLGHLVIGGALESRIAPWVVPDAGQLTVLWIVALAIAAQSVRQRLAWPVLSPAARVLLGIAALLSTFAAVRAVLEGEGWPWWWPGGAIAVVSTLAAGVWLLWRLDGPRARPGAMHAPTAYEPIALAWFAMLHGALAVYLSAAHFVVRHQSWTAAAVIVLPTLMAWGVLAGVDRNRWPFDRDAPAWLRALALPWLALLVAWSVAVNLGADGAMSPLPYLPLLNPIDLAHGLLLLYGLRLRRSLRVGEPTLAGTLRRRRPQLAAGVALAGFWWITSVLVRSLHHYAGTPIWWDGALGAGLVQTGLSILWTLLALAAMLLGARRVDPKHARMVWLAGGVLLAVVVAKLMLVDLSQTSALQRIVSFVGVGLLMLLVGYVAPLPPQAARGEGRSSG